jgi:hypothetical protein
VRSHTSVGWTFARPSVVAGQREFRRRTFAVAATAKSQQTNAASATCVIRSSGTRWSSISLPTCRTSARRSFNMVRHSPCRGLVSAMREGVGLCSGPAARIPAESPKSVNRAPSGAGDNKSLGKQSSSCRAS